MPEFSDVDVDHLADRMMLRGRRQEVERVDTEMAMSESERIEATVWMRCPYTNELCGSDATLTNFNSDNSGWSGLLVCANDHRFVLSQFATADGGLVDV